MDDYAIISFPQYVLLIILSVIRYVMLGGRILVSSKNVPYTVEVITSFLHLLSLFLFALKVCNNSADLLLLLLWLYE